VTQAETDVQNGLLMRRATYAAVAVALTLIAMKAGAFVVTGSIAMMATLFDSILDMAASVLNLIAVRTALTPADHDHRFGHGKAEAMAGLGQSAIIALSAVYIVYESVSRLIEPALVAASGIGIGVTVLAIALTLALVSYQARVVRQTNSLAIAADSIHYRGDLLMNLAVIAALALSIFPSFWWADPFFGILIAAFIVHSAWSIAVEAINQLMDREMPEEERAQIRAIVMADKDVMNMHDLRTRMAGNKSFIQFHLELDGNLTLKAAHDIADRVEDAVKNVFPQSEVISHQDPAGVETITAFERS
jgi:ferrous-iron efflux pump FieF